MFFCGHSPRLAIVSFSMLTMVSAQVVPPVPAESKADNETVVLSPFTVDSGDNNGYRANNTLSGTRLKSDLTGRGSAWEEFAFYFLGNSNGTPHCVIFLPRNPKYQTEIGIVEEGAFHTRPFRDLTELLAGSPP